MLIRIGDEFFEAAEIAAVRPAASASKTVLVLRCGRECTILRDYEDALGDLAAAGLLADPESMAMPKLEPEEREELSHLAHLGFRWIARDADGKIYAYRDFPSWDGGYWSTALTTSDTVRLDNDYDFVEATAHKPWSIEELL